MKKLLIPYVVIWSIWAPPALCNELTPWGLPVGPSAYPDVTALITGGDGFIVGTGIRSFFDASCNVTNDLDVIMGNQFTYTSGNLYRANLLHFFSNLQSQNTPAAIIEIYDGHGRTAGSACLLVTCASASRCAFSPSSVSLTF